MERVSGRCICYIFGRTLLTINSSSSHFVLPVPVQSPDNHQPLIATHFTSPRLNIIGIRNRPSPLTCANIPTFQRRHELGHGRAGRRARMVYDGWSTETGREGRRIYRGLGSCIWYRSFYPSISLSLSHLPSFTRLAQTREPV